MIPANVKELVERLYTDGILSYQDYLRLINGLPKPTNCDECPAILAYKKVLERLLNGAENGKN